MSYKPLSTYYNNNPSLLGLYSIVVEQLKLIKNFGVLYHQFTIA
jgi:hypothetical protein